MDRFDFRHGPQTVIDFLGSSPVNSPVKSRSMNTQIVGRRFVDRYGERLCIPPCVKNCGRNDPARYAVHLYQGFHLERYTPASESTARNSSSDSSLFYPFMRKPGRHPVTNRSHMVLHVVVLKVHFSGVPPHTGVCDSKVPAQDTRMALAPVDVDFAYDHTNTPARVNQTLGDRPIAKSTRKR